MIIVVAAVLSAAAAAIGTRMIIDAPAEGANGLLQAFLAGVVIFGAYWLVAGIAGYIGVKAMPLIMGAGIGFFPLSWRGQGFILEAHGAQVIKKLVP